MATLTGKIIDVTSRPPDSISSITVKAPSARVGSGTDVIVSSPAVVVFDETTGDITISGLTGGLSWLYIEGDGWSDSIALAVAEGMITLVEAIANAAGVPGLVDFIDLLVGLQARIDEIAQGAVDEAAQSIRWYRGLVPAGTSSLAQLDDGLWSVASASLATDIGLPIASTGSLVLQTTGSRQVATFKTPQLSGQPGQVFEGSTDSEGVWSWWASASKDDLAELEWVGETLTAQSDLSTLRPGRAYGVGLPSVAASLGLPQLRGVVEILSSANQKSLRYTTWQGLYPPASNKQIWHADFLEDGTLGPLRRVAWAHELGTNQYAVRHDALVEEARAITGVKEVEGVGVALVFDHGTNYFNETLLPMLTARGLPATIALNSNMYDEGVARFEHDNRTNWQIVSSWADDGIEIANHGKSHLSATGQDAVDDLLTGLAELKAALPNVPIHSFVTPSSLPLIRGAADFDTDFGRELWGSHAYMVSATTPSDWSLDAGFRQGVGRVWIDSPSGISSAKTRIMNTDPGRGLIVSGHPEVVGNSGNTTTAELAEFLDWLVVQRDAGRVTILTLRELAAAEPKKILDTAAIDDALQEKADLSYVDSSVADVRTFHGAVAASTTSLNQLVDGGHEVLNLSKANEFGLPAAGTLFLSSWGSQRTGIYVTGTNEVYHNATRLGEWQSWKQTITRSELPMISPKIIRTGDNVDVLTGPEHADEYYIASTPAPGAITGLPVDAAGRFIVRTTGIKSQIFIPYRTAKAEIWVRNYNISSGAWGTWTRIGEVSKQEMDAGDTATLASAKSYTDEQIAAIPSGGSQEVISAGEASVRHMMRADTAKKRHGYRIPTNGQAVVMLRFDDYPQDFQNKVLPILQKYALPAYFATTVSHIEEHQPTPWADVESWCVNNGIRLWNHSWTHGNATDPEGIMHQIVEAADYFEQVMPMVAIDGWVQPGVGTTPPYMDFVSGDPQSYTETLAGRLLLSRHGLVNGSRPGHLHPMGGYSVGTGHTTFEQSTFDSFKTMVESTYRGPYSLSLMAHPARFDEAGYISLADFDASMAFLASERDAGRLMVLTGDAAIALDSGSGERHDLIPGGAASWSNTGIGVQTVARGVSTAPIAWACGGAREFVGTVEADGPGEVRFTITGAGLDVEKIVPVQAGANTIRQFFAVPATGGYFTMQLRRNSGGVITLTDAHAYAA